MAQQLLASSATNAGHQVAWPLLTAAGGDLRLPGRPDVGAGWTGALTVTDRRTHPAGMQQIKSRGAPPEQGKGVDELPH